MRAGTFRHRIQLQMRNPGKDELQQPLLTWADVPGGAMWADIEPMSGRELMLAQANQSELTHTVSIRYQQRFADPRAMAALRVKYGVRIFNIHASIDPSERHQTLELSCSEGLNDG